MARVWILVVVLVYEMYRFREMRIPRCPISVSIAIVVVQKSFVE